MSTRTRRSPEEIAADYAERSRAALRRAMFASHPHRSEARSAAVALMRCAQDETNLVVKVALQEAAENVQIALNEAARPSIPFAPDETPPLFPG